MIDFIRDQVPRVEVLAQLAEEAAELGHAALKLRRVIEDRNPTPVSLHQALENLAEEIADVMLCARVLDFEADFRDPEMDAIVRFKLQRWATRLGWVERRRRPNGKG